jgi:hypothetical protein
MQRGVGRVYLQQYFSCLINQIAGSWGAQCVPMLNAAMVMYKGDISCLPEWLLVAGLRHRPSFHFCCYTRNWTKIILFRTVTPCSLVRIRANFGVNSGCILSVEVNIHAGNDWNLTTLLFPVLIICRSMLQAGRLRVRNRWGNIFFNLTNPSSSIRPWDLLSLWLKLYQKH